MARFSRSLKRHRTTEIDAFRKEFEDNYDDVAYLEDLAERVAIYNKGYPVREGYILLDEIDERILELEDGS
jgi:hypothetical protein